MFDSTMVLLLGTGLILGLLHAFDADHIMAVSSLSQRSVTTRGLVSFCGRWALGHGVTIAMLTWLLLAFDWQLGESASLWAERAIGLLLLVAGGWLMVRLYKPTLRLHTHSHGDLCHTHLIDNQRSHDNTLGIALNIHEIHPIANHRDGECTAKSSKYFPFTSGEAGSSPSSLITRPTLLTTATPLARKYSAILPASASITMFRVMEPVVR